MVISACVQPVQNNSKKNESLLLYQPGSFGYDLHFLQQYDSVIVLQTDDRNAKIIVSPKYQAKVFTSTCGTDGTSFGWLNYKAFSAATNGHMNAFGGENRFWLGPEGGKFSLFFNKGAKMEFANWKTPAAFDTEPWSIAGRSDYSVHLQKQMSLTNYNGNQLHLLVNRTITILTQQKIDQLIGIKADTALRAVGYETNNELTNTGTSPWSEKTGLPCMWILDMFKPTPETVIIFPFKKAKGKPFTEIATTNYFGEIPSNRIKHTDEVLFFKADGKYRGKIGIHPQFAKQVAGSYDYKNKVLTVIIFQIDSTAKYLNQEWNTTKPPFSGDAANAYNDGPLADGSQMGPFYEIESVSPAAFLPPKQTLSHRQSVFHFSGSEQGINAIVENVFGVTVADIKKAL